MRCVVTIYFESHGTTFDNEKDLSSGHNDVALSPLGEQQSREMGERYSAVALDAVFASDLQRAYRSGEIAFAGRDVPIFRDARLREVDYGDLTQRPAEEVKTEKPKRISEPFPNGESYEQAADRMRSFLGELLEKHQGKTVMVIGHRATQYGLERWVLGKPLDKVIPAPWKWQPGWTYQLEKIAE